MTLATDVAALLARRLPAWTPVLNSVGIVVNVAHLGALQNPIAINRRVPGFEDFSEAATRAIEPGDPGLSLLYHAFASPNVHLGAHNKPGSAADYLTLAELDLLENYIYSLAPPPPLDDLVVGVFAYEYRPGVSTSHQLHADLMFSRTGVARIGSIAPQWSAPDRCYLGRDPVRPGKVAAMPARYGAFLAARRRGRPDQISLVGNRDEDDGDRTFLFPVRKLFAGAECLPGSNLAIAFHEYHRAEKLQRIVTVGEVKLKDGFNKDAAPLFRKSGQGAPLVHLEPSGASVLVSSPPDELVRYAKQRNALSGNEEVVSFEVPSSGLFFKDFARNRHYTTLMLVEDWWTLAPEILIGETTGGHPRLAPRNVPNFVNIRHEVRPGGAVPVDLGIPGNTGGEDYKKYISKGGYQAAMFEDSICDGAITAKVAGLPKALPSRAAFSVVTAPDFFPFADELHLSYHAEATPDQFKTGGPAPLSAGRYPVNPQVLRDAAGDASPDMDDETMVAIVGRVRNQASSIQDQRRRGSVWARTTSYLTDAASGVFAPGWDVTFCGSLFGKFYATYGLGSPFPGGREALRRIELVLAGRGARCVAHLSAPFDADRHSDARRRVGLSPKESGPAARGEYRTRLGRRVRSVLRVQFRRPARRELRRYLAFRLCE